MMGKVGKQAGSDGAIGRLAHRSGKPTASPNVDSDGIEAEKPTNSKKWSFGVLNDRYTDEVPGDNIPYTFYFQLYRPSR